MPSTQFNLISACVHINEHSHFPISVNHNLDTTHMCEHVLWCAPKLPHPISEREFYSIFNYLDVENTPKLTSVLDIVCQSQLIDIELRRWMQCVTTISHLNWKSRPLTCSIWDVFLGVQQHTIEIAISFQASLYTYIYADDAMILCVIWGRSVCDVEQVEGGTM